MAKKSPRDAAPSLLATAAAAAAVAKPVVRLPPSLPPPVASLSSPSRRRPRVLGFLLVAVLVVRVATGASTPPPSSTTSSSSIPSSSSSPKNFICVGGSSGMGKAAALECLLQGGNVLLISRSADKLSAAKQELTMMTMTMRMMATTTQDSAEVADDADNREGEDDGGDGDRPDAAAGFDGQRIETAALDVTDEDAVREFAAHRLRGSYYDALVVSAAGGAPHGPVLDLPTEESRRLVESKVWTAYHCSKHFGPMLRDGGAVVFVSGILGRRPGVNCAALAMANGALEGLTRSLALEWGPRLRVNCLSPGFCDTERFDAMPPGRREAMLANTAASLPLRRVGRPDDMGRALFYLATAEFCTGVVLDVDGGHMIRQYASPHTDPMRRTDEDDQKRRPES